MGRSLQMQRYGIVVRRACLAENTVGFSPPYYWWIATLNRVPKRDKRPMQSPAWVLTSQAALDNLSSFTVFVCTSFDFRSNHFTSTRFFLKYFSTSMTFPSILLRTRSPFLNNLLISTWLTYFRIA